MYARLPVVAELRVGIGVIVAEERDSAKRTIFGCHALGTLYKHSFRSLLTQNELKTHMRQKSIVHLTVPPTTGLSEMATVS